VRAVVAFVSVGFEEISPTVRQDNGAVVRTEWRRTYQALLLEVPLGLGSVVTAIVKIAFGDDPEGTDGGQHPALGAVDVVHAIAPSHRPALTAAWQVEVLREHVARVTIGCMIAFAAAAAAAEASVPCISAVPAVGGSRIVSVEHDPLPRIERRMTMLVQPLVSRFEYARHEDASQSIDGACWTVMDGVGCWRREIGAIE
jgi:hypothetical protein